MEPENESQQTPETQPEQPVTEDQPQPEPIVEIVAEPIVEPVIEPEPEVTEDAATVANEEPVVAQEKPVGVYINSEKPELYTIEAYDLNAYPELSQQGVQYGDKVAYNSLWVYKSSTASGAKDTKSRFPASTSSKLF